MMMTVKHFIDGHALYDEVPTFYGPFYYLCEWFLHAVLKIPLSNDYTKLICIVFWIAISGLISLCALRLTRRVSVAAIVYLLVFLYLTFLVREPGHPQEICGLLMAVCVAVAVPAAGEQGRGAALVAGASAGALAVTKVNIGVFLLLSLLLASVAAAGHNRARIWFRALVAVAAMLFPFAIARSRLANMWVLNYAAVISLSIVPLLLIGYTSKWMPSWSACRCFVGSYATVAAAAVGFALWRGSTLGGIVNGLIVLPHRLSQFSVEPANISRWVILWSFASIAIALVHLRRERLGSLCRAGHYALLFSMIKLGFGLWIFSRVRGWDTWAMVSFGTPFLWLALTPFPSTSQNGAPSAARLLLCFIAAIQPFQAYPVPGTQRIFGTFLILLIAAVCVDDVVSWIDQTQGHRSIVALLRRAGLPLVLIGAAILCLHRYHTVDVYYRGLTPIGMPGAEWIRIDPPQATTYHWLVANLADCPDTFLCTKGLNSLYFWTGRKPPSPIVIGNNLDIYTPEQQRTVIESLASRPRICIVTHPGLLFKGLQTQQTNAILKYVEDNFTTYDSFNKFELKHRKGQPQPERRPHPTEPVLVPPTESRSGPSLGTSANDLRQRRGRKEGETFPRTAEVGQK
jgi:hypothetical protein